MNKMTGRILASDRLTGSSACDNVPILDQFTGNSQHCFVNILAPVANSHIQLISHRNTCLFARRIGKS